jgi:serine/threonine protein kinase
MPLRPRPGEAASCNCSKGAFRFLSSDTGLWRPPVSGELIACEPAAAKMAEMQKAYPTSAADYKLQEEIGQGVSALVYRAVCIPYNEVVAVKVLDLEKCNNSLVRCSLSTLK